MVEFCCRVDWVVIDLIETKLDGGLVDERFGLSGKRFCVGV